MNYVVVHHRVQNFQRGSHSTMSIGRHGKKPG